MVILSYNYIAGFILTFTGKKEMCPTVRCVAVFLVIITCNFVNMEFLVQATNVLDQHFFRDNKKCTNACRIGGAVRVKM